jgi:hypothetical protein
MKIRINLARGSRKGFRLARTIVLALVTPLFEKNPVKVATFSRCYVPLVLSMARVIVLLFAVFMLAQVKRHGIVGWPEATLCIAIVLALPLLNALERVNPHETISVAKSLFGRFGIGAARGFASGYEREPSKLDDHRADAGETPALDQAA